MSKSEKNTKVINNGGPAGGIYFLAAIGAAVYFVQQSDGFWQVVLALLKALVWPAFLMHRVMEVLNL